MVFEDQKVRITYFGLATTRRRRKFNFILLNASISNLYQMNA